ncbi:hypothetical protein [Saccharolobus sp. A20]|nr:hypothetical protein [Sulfolobus sp. A20]
MRIRKVVNTLKKTLSFLVTSNGVTPIKGRDALCLSITLAFRARRRPES